VTAPSADRAPRDVSLGGVPDGTPATPPARAARLTPRARVALAVVLWVVATALVLAALRAVGGPTVLAAVRRARPAWLLAAVACHACIVPLWAWQTHVLVPRVRGPARGRVPAAPAARPPRFARLFEVQALTATAANTIPAFLGQATGVALLAERAGLGTAGALSVFAQHNLVEGVAKLAMVGVAAQVAPLPPRMRQGIAVLVAGTALLVVLLGAAAWWAGRRPAEAGAPAGAGAIARGRALLVRWAASLDAVRDPRRLAAALGLALLMKVAEGAGWWAVERAFGVAPRPGSPALALAATNLASAVPASPGNLGVYEGAAYTAYHVVLGVPRDAAAAIALAGHAVYLVPLVGLGWAALSARHLRALGARRRARTAGPRSGAPRRAPDEAV
jgi:uncharacterized membrane protein YbhN (UPF0104 family)